MTSAGKRRLRRYYRKLLVIDDLADRPHRCDLLLDQNLGRQPQDYAGLVPAHYQLLIGPHFALMRPEFAALRPYSLQRRRAQPALRQLLITMGGVDPAQRHRAGAAGPQNLRIASRLPHHRGHGADGAVVAKRPGTGGTDALAHRSGGQCQRHGPTHGKRRLGDRCGGQYVLGTVLPGAADFDGGAGG